VFTFLPNFFLQEIESAPNPLSANCQFRFQKRKNGISVVINMENSGLMPHNRGARRSARQGAHYLEELKSTGFRPSCANNQNMWQVAPEWNRGELVFSYTSRHVFFWLSPPAYHSAEFGGVMFPSRSLTIQSISS
jgi:hypothetical protein